MSIEWEKEAKELFEKITSNLPQFHRSIAQSLVKGSAEDLARARNAEVVEKVDLIKAFFKEVPPAFKDMMVRLLDHLKIDYKEHINE
ncbi:MAG: DUF2621 family protein [Candidatus Omnitrophica bacterium]|nr:DUF2621 family protein [Candidatus Omnitrophota bacterium]